MKELGNGCVAGGLLGGGLNWVGVKLGGENWNEDLGEVEVVADDADVQELS